MNPMNQTHACPTTTSQKYKFFSTETLVKELQSLGWYVSKTKIARTRSVARMGYQRHFIRLSPPVGTVPDTRDGRFECILFNAHDGSGALKIYGGYIRFACDNGLIVGGDMKASIRHNDKNGMQKALAAVYEIAGKARDVANTIERAKNRHLMEHEINALVIDACKIVWPKASPDSKLISEMQQIRRAEDYSSDLWTIFNRIQESAVRGGCAKDEGRATRAISNVSREVYVNTKLWDLMVEKLG